jgi:uracil-DNA glycosylase
MAAPGASIEHVIEELQRCRVCRDAPLHGTALAHEPRPIIQAGRSARLCIAGQAPGIRVHASGKPFTDPSGVRLRQWLAMEESTFYDSDKVAIVPMGHCFPGLDAKGGDLPPRRECAPIWRTQVFAALPKIELILVIGQYAQAWHLSPEERDGGLTATVMRWKSLLASLRHPRVLPMPHPSWRNSGWLKANPWFESELLPVLQSEIAQLIA